MLLFRGVDKSICNAGNQTASELATLSGFSELAVMIDNFRSQDVGKSSCCISQVIVIV